MWLSLLLTIALAVNMISLIYDMFVLDKSKKLRRADIVKELEEALKDLNRAKNSLFGAHLTTVEHDTEVLLDRCCEMIEKAEEKIITLIDRKEK